MQFLYGQDGAPLSVRAPGGQAFHYHYDAFGSVERITKGAQLAVRYQYDSFGNIVETQTGPAYDSALLGKNPFRFMGRYGVRYDPDLNLYELQGRFYHPVLGRYLSRSSEFSYVPSVIRDAMLLGSAYAPVDESGKELRVFVSAELASDSERPFTIRRLAPLGVDPLLDITFMGWCQGACIGTAYWSSEERTTAELSTSALPFELEPQKKVYLTFLVALKERSSLATVRSRCEVGVDALRVQAQGFETFELRGPEQHVVGLRWGSGECD